jgi:hypothetical protein
MNSEQDTLPNNQTLLAAINNLHEEINSRFEQMRLQMMSFDVRIDRLEAASHELLNIAFNTRADVKVLREEVRAWAKDVAELSEKAA